MAAYVAEQRPVFNLLYKQMLLDLRKMHTLR